MSQLEGLLQLKYSSHEKFQSYKAEECLWAEMFLSRILNVY